MKRIILLLFVIFITKMASAQEIETGIRFNYNISDWHGDVWQGVNDVTSQSSEIAALKNRRGFSAGVYATKPLSDYLNIESGLFYDQKGVGVRVRPFESFLSPQIKTTVQLDYITVPLNFNIKALGDLHLTAGASVSKLVSSKMGVRGSWLGVGLGETFPIRNLFNDWDFNLQGGAQYQFSNKFHLKAEYRYGLSRLNKGLIDADVYNQGLTMGIGYNF